MSKTPTPYRYVPTPPENFLTFIAYTPTDMSPHSTAYKLPEKNQHPHTHVCTPKRHVSTPQRTIQNPAPHVPTPHMNGGLVNYPLLMKTFVVQWTFRVFLTIHYAKKEDFVFQIGLPVKASL